MNSKFSEKYKENWKKKNIIEGIFLQKKEFKTKSDRQRQIKR